MQFSLDIYISCPIFQIGDVECEAVSNDIRILEYFKDGIDMHFRSNIA